MKMAEKLFKVVATCLLVLAHSKFGATGACNNIDNGAIDKQGKSCSEYSRFGCGRYDDADFNSYTMCCTCGGGFANASRYDMEGGMLCADINDDTYDTLSEAQNACNDDANCGFVYDSTCSDGTNEALRTCPKSAQIQHHEEDEDDEFEDKPCIYRRVEAHWIVEVKNRFCKNNVMSQVKNQLECQTLCADSVGCVGVSYSHKTTGMCYVCMDDILTDALLGYGFYRKVMAYQLTQDNRELCSDIGRNLVTSETECRSAALKLGLSFSSAEDASDWPTGCYLSGSTYWNTHPNGDLQRQQIAQHVCAESVVCEDNSACSGNAVCHIEEGHTVGICQAAAPETSSTASTSNTGSSYTIANANLLCSDVNLEPIESLIECRNSVIDLKKSNPQIVFSEEEEIQNYPKGCYIYEGTHIYWNKHSTGSRNALGRPVCNAE